MTKLRVLSLQGTGITDAGFEQLQRLTKLRTLDIESPAIVGFGLKYLATLRDLEDLGLSDLGLATGDLLRCRRCRSCKCSAS